jgi:Flp pilus assembly protein TadB
MCLPSKTDQPASSPASGAGPVVGVGGLMLLACLAGPVLAGALGGLGAGLLVGAAGVIFALALCAAVPAIGLALRRRAARRQAMPERQLGP